MRVCLNCLIEYEDEKKFCKKCGAELESRAAKKNCPDCLIEYEPDKKFCKKCGRELEPGPPPSVSHEENKSAGRATGEASPGDGAPAQAQAPRPAKQAPPKTSEDATRPVPPAPPTPEKARIWYELVVPLMMWLFAIGLVVAAVNVFSVDGFSDFNDDEVRIAWAMVAGSMVSAVTGVFLWRRKPSARIFLSASILVLALVPLLVVLFFLINEY